MTGIVTMGSVPYQQDFELCDLLKEYVELSCPVKKGTFSVVMKFNVPDFVPAVR